MLSIAPPPTIFRECAPETWFGPLRIRSRGSSEQLLRERAPQPLLTAHYVDGLAQIPVDVGGFDGSDSESCEVAGVGRSLCSI